jgi:hypothetical protein
MEICSLGVSNAQGLRHSVVSSVIYTVS